METEFRPDTDPERASAFLWNIRNLFVDPGIYFAGISAPAQRTWLYLFAFIYSLAYAIDRVEMGALRDSPLPQTWAAYWTIVGASAAVGLLFIFWLGGFWYRFRLGLCGVRDADQDLVRLVYLSAAQIYALPTIVATVILSLFFRNPTAAWLGQPDAITYAMFLFPLWSYWASYVGVRTVFRARKTAAAIWFLVLPAALFAATAAFVIWVGTTRGFAEMAPAADVLRPLHYAGRDVAFSYPGNWGITNNETSSDRESSVTLECIGGAGVMIEIFVPRGSSEEHLEGWAASLTGEKDFTGLVESGSIVEWGSLSGVGRRLEGTVEGRSFEFRLFITALAEDRLLSTFEILPIASRDSVEPGFDLIRRTFRSLL